MGLINRRRAFDAIRYVRKYEEKKILWKYTFWQLQDQKSIVKCDKHFRIYCNTEISICVF